MNKLKLFHIPAKNKKRFFVEIMGMFIVLLLIVFTLFANQRSTELEALREAREMTDLSVVDFQFDYLESEMEEVRNDLLFLTNLRAFNDLVVGIENGIVDQVQAVAPTGNQLPVRPDMNGERPPKSHKSSPMDVSLDDFATPGMPQGNTIKNMLQRDIAFYMSIDDDYEEIIYVDEEGNEIMHLSRYHDQLYYIEDNNLRNISSDAIFTDAYDLEKGLVYQSPLYPLKPPGLSAYRPRINFATSVYDYKDNYKGMLILSYNATSLLEDYKLIGENTESDYFLIDDKGFILVDKTTLFMKDYSKGLVPFLEEDEFNRLAADFTTDDIVQDYFEDGHITAAVIGGDDDLTRPWYALLIAQESEYTFMTEVISIGLMIDEAIEYWYFGIGLLLLSYGMTLIIHYRRRYISDITEMAQIDAMTGTFNRNAGLNMLDKNMQYALKSGKDYSLCFVDVNNLKAVNDKYGHELGDQYLIDSVQVMRSGFRTSEQIIRLGGDEFLIGIQGTIDYAEKDWQRVKDAMSLFNKTSGRPYDVSLSHGLATISELSDISIDALIAIADQRMYEEKKRIKKIN